MTNKPSRGTGGGETKVNPIIMAVITTIIAPVVVFFVTNNLKASPEPVPTPIIQVVTATAPAAHATQPADPPTITASTAVSQLASTPTPTYVSTSTSTATTAPTQTPVPTATATPTDQPTAAETPIAQPAGNTPAAAGGTILAGTPVLVDGLELTINKQDIKLDGKTIGLSLRIKNTTQEKRTLTFTPGSITLKDNTNHNYAPLYGDKKEGCKKEELNAPHKVEIEAKGEITLVSVNPDKLGEWCADKPGSAVPRYTGPLGKGAKTLLVQIKGLGPFNGFQIEINL